MGTRPYHEFVNPISFIWVDNLHLKTDDFHSWLGYTIVTPKYFSYISYNAGLVGPALTVFDGKCMEKFNGMFLFGEG